ncbi:MAG: hypothetical protein GY811_06445, partial [Myxococcales bacterium]|nr:hypothetical protein [Myxococcales bacterium]
MATERQQEFAIYGLCLVGLLGLCLWPIWGVRFLPMQDYPQHLFLSYVLATFDDPSMNWAETYSVHFEVGPYALYYVAMRA